MTQHTLKQALIYISPLIDFILSPLTVLAAIWLKYVRKIGVKKMPLSRKIFNKVGVFPIREHYYEPLFNFIDIKRSLREDRNLPGLNLNVSEQLDLIGKFNYNFELLKFSTHQQTKLEFYYNNPSFASGDAEYLYNIIRHFKPRRMIEIGSGFSTLMAINAICMNKIESHNYTCEQICIEPYEMNWLEDVDVKLERKLVENVDKSLFFSLSKNDILFIDSSHIIRPQGDVLFEYLEILPILNSGVIVHIHDIFTPKDYLNELVLDEMRFWNEQYLLEAFLSNNSEFRIIGALNYLTHHHPQELSKCCPILKQQIAEREPGSFWIVKN